MISRESSEISQMYTYITRVFINIGSGSGYEEEDPPMRFRSPNCVAEHFEADNCLQVRAIRSRGQSASRYQG